MIILGISAFNHDSAAGLLINGQPVFAAAEERFSRVKHDAGFPAMAARACLDAYGLTPDDLDAVAFYERPEIVLARRLWTAVKWPVSRAHISTRNVDLECILDERLGYTGCIMPVAHHLSHAAWAYHSSGLCDAAILSMDGVGEWATMASGVARNGIIEITEDAVFPHSLGLFYAMITGFLGFHVNSGEYKVMGLAPYGKPRLAEKLAAVISLNEEGSLRIDQSYFDFESGERMHSAAFETLVSISARLPGAPLSADHIDLAASAQVVLESLLLAIARRLHEQTDQSALCLGGGVTLNCTAVGRLADSGIFQRVFAAPAPGDDGAALGAAFVAARSLGETIPKVPVSSLALGPNINLEVLDETLGPLNSLVARFESPAALAEVVADRLSRGDIVAWAQGRAEFGPRALGSRSILADPRPASMRERLNAQIKERESFRPFAPAILLERAADYFEIDSPSPFMQRTVRVRQPTALAAVTHIDGSARVQTVDRSVDPGFAALLDAFEVRTGCPVLLNTSLNLSGEPIAQAVEEIARTFVHSGCDVLAIGPCLVNREQALKIWGRIPPPRRGEGGRPPSTSVYSIF